MQSEILTEKQKELLPYIKKYKRNFYLVGGTFREQIAFHKDIDYSEPVEYLVQAPTNEQIKIFLIESAIKF